MDTKTLLPTARSNAAQGSGSAIKELQEHGAGEGKPTTLGATCLISICWSHTVTSVGAADGAVMGVVIEAKIHFPRREFLLWSPRLSFCNHVRSFHIANRMSGGTARYIETFDRRRPGCPRGSTVSATPRVPRLQASSRTAASERSRHWRYGSNAPIADIAAASRLPSLGKRSSTRLKSSATCAASCRR